MNVPEGWAIDLDGVLVGIELDAGAAGGYGAVAQRTVPPGFYLVLVDNNVAVRPGALANADMRVGATGGKLELAATPAVPLPVFLRTGQVSFAAEAAAAVVRLAPLIRIDERAAAAAQASKVCTA